MDTMSIEEYQAALLRHDWYYDFTDDASVWRRGNANQKRLETISGQTPIHKALWDRWVGWVNGKGDTPRPTLDDIGQDDTQPDDLYDYGPEPETEEEAEAIERKFNTDDLSEEVEAAYVEGDQVAFLNAVDHSATVESAKAYLEQRQDDLMKLKAMLWDNQNSIAPGWEIRRYANSKSVCVCSVVNEDVDWAKDFETIEQALAYILARWW